MLSQTTLNTHIKLTLRIYYWIGRFPRVNFSNQVPQMQKLTMQYRLDLKEKALRSQYAALDGLVGQLRSTSQFLSQQLG